MAENVIFSTQNITGFSYNSTFGAFWQYAAPCPFELTEGQEYTILWDGIEYTRTAFAFINALDGSSCVAVGNKMVSTGVDDGDLFAIVNDMTNSYTHYFSTEDKTEHSVGIYQVIEDETETETGIILKDFAGNEGVYKVDKVMFDTSDGGTQIFSKGEAVEGVEIALDDLDLNEEIQTVTAADGTLMKSVKVIKPENLLPENIAKDVEIAGVVGTHSGGDFDFEDENLKFFTYRIDTENKQIILYSILYAVLYEANGSYDVNIPNRIGGYDVLIACV